MGVEFQEDNSRRDFESQKTPKLAKFLISKGIASDVASANKVEIVMALIFIALAVVVYIVF